jgi:hypothetical protein
MAGITETLKAEITHQRSEVSPEIIGGVRWQQVG